MRYVASDSIRIFPTSNRGAGPTGTNWVTEHNLASIIANLVNNSRNNNYFNNKCKFSKLCFME